MERETASQDQQSVGTGRRQHRWLPAGAALVVAIAAGCAAACMGNLSATPPGPIVPGTAAHPRAVNVILRDYVFVPTPILLVPGEMVRFQIIDGGLLAHEFALGPQAFQDAYERADAAAAVSLPGATPRPASVPSAVASAGLRLYLDPGQEADLTYLVPAQGAPPLLECHIPGHVAKGMVGKVVYVAPGATGP